MKESDWDRYWEGARGGRFTRVSWSKRRMEAVLEPFLRPGVRVLDAGCGSGYFSAHFVDRDCRVSTLDHSKEALEMARRLTKGRAEEYLADDLLDPSFAERHAEKYDLVFTDGLFEHFQEEEQRRILGNFIAALCPGGLVATFVPNKYSWWTLVRPFVMPGIYEKPFGRSGLLSLHEGLSIEGEGGISVWPFRHSPDRILGRSFGMLRYVLARKEKAPY